MAKQAPSKFEEAKVRYNNRYGDMAIQAEFWLLKIQSIHDLLKHEAHDLLNHFKNDDNPEDYEFVFSSMGEAAEFFSSVVSVCQRVMPELDTIVKKFDFVIQEEKVKPHCGVSTSGAFRSRSMYARSLEEFKRFYAPLSDNDNLITLARATIEAHDENIKKRKSDDV